MHAHICTCVPVSVCVCMCVHVSVATQMHGMGGWGEEGGVVQFVNQSIDLKHGCNNLV